MYHISRFRTKEKTVVKHISKLSVTALMALLSGACHLITKESSAQESVARAQEFQPQITLPSSVVVCRSKQCAPASLSMSKEYIYNSLTHLLNHNLHEKAMICQADPYTHVCTEDYVTLPITVGVTPANLYINNVELIDVSVALNKRSIDLLLDYGISYNGQVPTCKSAESLIYVKDTKNIVLEDSGYSCKMTTIGNTTIKTMFAIDYIDLDYGFVGGYYSIGLSGPAFGGRSGYMMFKFKNDAYPLSADLILKEPEPEEVQKAKEEALKAKLREELKDELKDELKAEAEAAAQAQAGTTEAEIVAESDQETLIPVILDEQGMPVYEFIDNTLFEGSECYSTELTAMPCYEQWPCYEEPALNKVICPEPKAQTFTIIQDDGSEIKRSKGVITPKALDNIRNKTALKTKDIKAVKTETTDMSVYEPSVSQEMKGTQYNGVEVFPIYQRRKK